MHAVPEPCQYNGQDKPVCHLRENISGQQYLLDPGTGLINHRLRLGKCVSPALLLWLILSQGSPEAFMKPVGMSLGEATLVTMVSKNRVTFVWKMS